jgi:hypothetical protein
MSCRYRIGALALVVVVVVTACGADDVDSDVTASSPAPPTAASPNDADGGEPPAESTVVATVDGADDDASLGGAEEFGVDEAQDIVDEIASTFAPADFSPVEELLGDDGMWIAVTGEEYDRSTVGPLLQSYTDQSGIEAHIVDVVRADETVEGLGGHGFKMTETLSNGREATFWIFVAQNEEGGLTVTLRVRPPRG